MTALLLKSDSFTVTSVSNVSAGSSKDYLTRDLLGLDTVVSNSPIIILDKGGNTSWDCIAFVQSTMPTTATVKVEYSNDSTFATGVTTLGPVASGISSVNPSRSKCHVHELAAATTLRYIRITLTGAGAMSLGRIVIGTKITTAGIAIDGERLFEDMSDEYSYGAYSAFDDQPTLLGWKVTFPWMTETYFRQTWQPFFQSVGNSKCFLFIPNYDDPATIQSDWCYGRITTKAGAQTQGYNMWTMSVTMRGIYP